MSDATVVGELLNESSCPLNETSLCDEQLADCYRKSHDPSYYSLLYQRYHARLTTFLGKYISTYYQKSHGREIDIQAIVDDVLMLLHARCTEGEEIGNIQAWLFEVTRRRAQEAIRSFHCEKRGGHDTETFSLSDPKMMAVAMTQKRQTEKSPTAYQIMRWDERDHVLKEHLDKLPEQEADAISAVYLLGLRYDDASAQLNVSERTVRRRIANGIERLRLVLNRDFFLKL